MENKGYYFVTSMYGNDVNIIKQIIKQRIHLYNETIEKTRIHFDENIMTDEIYKKLVNKSNGNISLILDSFWKVVDLLDWHKGHIEDLTHRFDIEIDNQIGIIKQLRKNSPKLHL